MRAGQIFCLVALLAGCQATGPGSGGADPLTGEAIAVSTLDEPVAGQAQATVAGNPDPAAERVAPADVPSADEPPADPTVPPPQVEVPEQIDPALLTPEALACKRRGGIWSRIGEGEARSCLRRTRDGGKRCDADRDCQGVCLARSQTCAPIDPLFGCNEVLQDDGRRMTLCLE